MLSGPCPRSSVVTNETFTQQGSSAWFAQLQAQCCIVNGASKWHMQILSSRSFVSTMHQSTGSIFVEAFLFGMNFIAVVSRPFKSCDAWSDNYLRYHTRYFSIYALNVRQLVLGTASQVVLMTCCLFKTTSFVRSRYCCISITLSQ